MYSTSVYLFCFDSIVPSFGSFYEPYKCLTYMFRLHAENDKHSGSSFCFQPSNKILIKKEETGKQRQRQKKINSEIRSPITAERISKPGYREGTRT